MRYEISAPRRKRHSCVGATAAGQWGCVTTAQLRECGITTTTQDRWLALGLLHRMHQGVYVFGALSTAPEQRWAAALLAAGERAALSHTTAAALYGFVVVRAVTEVKSPTQRRGDETLRVHRGIGEVTRHRGLSVTTVRQTLLDLAAIGWSIDSMAHEAAARSLVSLGDVRAFALDQRGRRGATKLLKAVGLPHTRSKWERRFLRWVQTLDRIPRPIMNDEIGALTVDVHWPDHGLVFELDTEQTHGTPWARRRDARRDAYLRRRGKKVRRITAERFEPDAEESVLRALLA
jgi:hypothetical protein